MPRSGSTLLQNILGNNPDFYTTPTSPLLEFVKATKKAYTQSSTVKAQDTEEMKSAMLTFCRYGIHGFFDGITDRKYVLDKSREWGVNRLFLEAIYPNPKIICMVRDLTDIVASMEKNYQKHYDKYEEDMDTLSKRVSSWMNPKNKPVGRTLSNLREIFQKGYNKKILFVRFEDLCNNPKKQMGRIHDYLGVPSYDYDFNNIIQVTHENDKFHGKYGDHKIQNKVQPLVSKSKEILGVNMYNQIRKNNHWYFKTFNY
jgi:sulfotransferase